MNMGNHFRISTSSLMTWEILKTFHMWVYKYSLEDSKTFIIVIKEIFWYIQSMIKLRSDCLNFKNVFQ